MRVHFGADHAAYELKEELIAFVAQLGHEAVDHGPHVYDADDDYPSFVLPAAVAVGAEPDSLGVVLGGSGNGEQIAANKVTGVRAALAHNVETARLGREHNNAQIVAIGARQTDAQTAKEILRVFLSTPFSGEERHARRLGLVADYEATGRVPRS